MIEVKDTQSSINVLVPDGGINVSAPEMPAPSVTVTESGAKIEVINVDTGINVTVSDEQITVMVSEEAITLVTVAEPGPPGPPAADGYTPIKGVDYFDGTNGTNGSDGYPGADGHSPVVDFGSGGDADRLRVDSVVTGPHLTGPPGTDGADGAPGADGAAGPSNLIHESGGPTDLTVGAIADGEYLKRSGTTVISGVPTGATPSYPRGWIDGLILAYVDATNVDFGAGCARDSTNAYNLDNSSTIRKILNSSGSWTAGTNQNGLDTGARGNSTWYHCYIIRKTADGTTDFLYSTSATAPSLPAGYSGFRRIGSVRTNSSGNILKWIQQGSTFWWDAVVSDVSAQNQTNARILWTMSTPLGVITEGIFFGSIVTSGLESIRCLATAPDQVDTAPGNPSLVTFTSSGSTLTQGCVFRCRTNTSSQIGVRASQGSGNRTLGMGTHGWVDPRGQDL